MRVIEILVKKLRREGFFATMIAIVCFPFTIVKNQLAYKKMLKRDSLKQRFSDVYENNLWGSIESESGPGSEIEYTERFRDGLINMISKYNINRFVDAACGDFHWMKLVTSQLDIEYFGFDIVDSVIERNKKNYESNKVHFGVVNICEDDLPSCDLLMVRDCLFHLSFNDIDKFLNNIGTVDYKYLLTTTHIVDKDFRNSDILTGQFRLIDLFKEPFNFENKSVLEGIDDYPLGYPTKRQMVLIAKEEVPKKLIYDKQYEKN